LCVSLSQTDKTRTGSSTGSLQVGTGIHDGLISLFQSVQSREVVALDKDRYGNYFVPGGLFGGTTNVRAAYLKRDSIIVLDIAGVIEAVTGMARNGATKKLDLLRRSDSDGLIKMDSIQLGLLDDESKLYL
jgi:uncharacterized NAD(P)/FAD-binding protein YdhS